MRKKIVKCSNCPHYYKEHNQEGKHECLHEYRNGMFCDCSGFTVKQILIKKRMPKTFPVLTNTDKRKGERRVETETNKVFTGTSSAYSSKKSLYYHDIPPEFYRRVAKRHTGGHTKYNDDPVPITMNLNWRVGLDDPLYVMDRLNHVFEHLIDFLENGNAHDDNLGAIGWNLCFLMEAERMHPDVLKTVLGQGKYSGEEAARLQQELQHGQLVKQTIQELNSEPIEIVKKHVKKGKK